MLYSGYFLLWKRICSPPGSSVHGILQARTLDWVAISSSRESSQPRDRTLISWISVKALFLIWEVVILTPLYCHLLKLYISFKYYCACSSLELKKKKIWIGKKSCKLTKLQPSQELWCIGEGNGNPLLGKPLQWSCLESPRNGGAWWAAVYGVAQSRTRLTRLSSSRNKD